MVLSINDTVSSALKTFPSPTAYCLAYSGGLDSHVLLHVLNRLRDELTVPIQAIHINHGLQKQADEWQQHCATVCEALQVEFRALKPQLDIQTGDSVEAKARKARYAALATVVPKGGMLLTAQHQDDQAETLLLQLLRGAGVEGLAAMPICKPWQQGWHVRPLLHVPQADLQAYAKQHALRWIEDPSNQQQQYDRNYLRHSVMPLLRGRWPGAGSTLARSAGHIAAVLPLVKSQTGRDLLFCVNEHDRLQVEALRHLTSERRYAVLRQWIRQSGYQVPNQARLQTLDGQMLQVSADSQPSITWGSVALYVYQGELWLEKQRTGELPTTILPWPDTASIALPTGDRLQRRLAANGIPQRYWQEGRLTVRWRTEGVTCKPIGRDGSRTFKKLRQATGFAITGFSFYMFQGFCVGCRVIGDVVDEIRHVMCCSLAKTHRLA